MLALAVEGPLGLLRRRRRAQGVNLDRCEVISQSLTTIEGLIKTRFRLEGREFKVGQWLDVKDTVNQWLEAQVVQSYSNEGQQHVLIHYNGWPHRWDEWIESDSPRIMPLKAHTFQALECTYMSPCPVVPPDFNGITPKPKPMELCKVAGSFGRLLSQLLLSYAQANDAQRVSIVAELRVITDRLGRVMKDLAVLVGIGPVIETSTRADTLQLTEVELFLLAPRMTQ
jgi:hypothetical protein